MPSTSCPNSGISSTKDFKRTSRSASARSSWLRHRTTRQFLSHLFLERKRAVIAKRRGWRVRGEKGNSTQLKRGRQQRTHAEHNDQNTTTNNRQQKFNTSHMSQNAANAKEAWGTESLPRLQHRWQRRPNYHNGDIALISRKSGMRVGTFNASFALLRLRRRLRHIHHGLGAGEPCQAAGHGVGG